MVGIVLINAEADQGPFIALVISPIGGEILESALAFTCRESLIWYVYHMWKIYTSAGLRVEMEFVELSA